MASHRTTTPRSRALTVAVTLVVSLTTVPVQHAHALPAGTAAYVVTTDASGTATAAFGLNPDAPAMSADGRYVAFTTEAPNLGPTDTNDNDDVYLWDRDTGSTTLVSTNAAGTDSGDDGSRRPSISDDGRYVTFDSAATDLVATTDTDGSGDVFLWDRDTGTTTLVSTNVTGTSTADDDSITPVISADGSTVAFVSDATDVTNHTDTNGSGDVFVWDRSTGSTTLVTRNPSGTTGDGGSFLPALDADGSHVAFVSSARDLVVGISDPLIGNDVFLWDATSGVRLISRNEAGTTVGEFPSAVAAINDTGDRIAFSSRSADLVAETDTNADEDVFVWDEATDDLTQISRNASGTDSAAGRSYDPLMDADGSVIAFQSTAGDLGPTDTNGTSDLYAWEDTAGAVSLVSSNSAGTDAGNGPIVGNSADLSADGLTVSFASEATDHTADADANGVGDAFVRAGGSTALVSAAPGGGSAGGDTTTTWLAADSSAVLFGSTADDLVTGITDANGDTDLFMLDGPGTVAFSTASYGVDEADGTASVTVVRTGGRSAHVDVTLTTSDGTATAGADYVTSTGVISLPVGQRSVSVDVPLLDDGDPESDETVTLTITGPSSGAGLGLANATLTITDDDPPTPPPGGGGGGGGGGTPPGDDEDEEDEEEDGEDGDPGQSRPLTAACPPGAAPAGIFSDTTGPHEEAIECLAWWQLLLGYGDGTFGTADPMTRGQYATVSARLLRILPQALDPDPPDAFRDDDGDVHEPAANTLAAAGMLSGLADGTAGLDQPITRGQLASILLRLAEVTGADIPEGDPRFTDVAGPHAEAIERLAAAGIIVGIDVDRFAPGSLATRGQVASVTARFLALLAEEGFLAVPEHLETPTEAPLQDTER